MVDSLRTSLCADRPRVQGDTGASQGRRVTVPTKLRRQSRLIRWSSAHIACVGVRVLTHISSWSRGKQGSVLQCCRLVYCRQSLGAGANFDFCRSRGPIFMKSSLEIMLGLNQWPSAKAYTYGTGRPRQERPPSTLAAGPTPILWNIGPAARGSPQARQERRKVFALTADAA